MRWLLLSLSLQNLGRRKARSLLLIAAVALGSGVVFTKQFTAERITDRNVSAAVAVSSLQAPPLDFGPALLGKTSHEVRK